MLSLLGLKLIGLPSYMYERGGEDNLYSFLLFLFFDLIILLSIAFVIFKNENFSFSRFCEKYFGRWGAKLIYLLAFILFFFKAILLLSESFSYFRDTLYVDNPAYLYFFIMLALMFFFAVFGLKAFCRTAELFAWVFVLGLVVCLAMPFLSGRVELFVLPAQNGFGNVFLRGGQRAFWFGDYLFLLIFADKIKFRKREKKHFAFYYLFSVLFLAFFYLVFFRIFGADMAGMRNAITDLVGYTRKTIGISSIDWLPILLMMVLTCFQCGLFFFLSKDMFDKTTESERPRLFSLVWMIGVILCVWLWLKNVQIAQRFAQEILVYPAIALHYGIPLLFVVFTLFELLLKRRKQKRIPALAETVKSKRGEA